MTCQWPYFNVPHCKHVLFEINMSVVGIDRAEYQNFVNTWGNSDITNFKSSYVEEHKWV